MSTCSVTVASPLQHVGAAGVVGEKRQVGVGTTCEARFGGCSRVVRSRGAVKSTSLGGGGWRGVEVERRGVAVRAQAAGEGSLQKSEKWGEGVSLGTALLPPDVDLGRLESLLFQWGNSLTANANLPLPTSLKVDKVKGGVRLGYIRINEGAIEDLVHIDVTVNAAEGDQKAYFQATRNGQFKDKVPPGEPLIMQSLLQALRKSIQIARE
ncbi:hypothetical protein KC19_6G118300 [Ceratodon purpureus]|uniref:DUF7148 domain-containing protein n=1 Tax=Ceratodon purpureus TaxID=3225 RepID=A0A8T0HHE7_CERPU|nr:hypothetical protein KC19_6G118300 [Ceratodon purpureus]